MKTINLEFRKYFLQIVIWTIVLTGFALVALVEFQVFEQSGPELTQFLDSFPPILKSIFGISDTDLSQFSGYYLMIVYYLVIMLSIHGLFLGFSIASSEESENTADFILSKPVSRTNILLKKISVGIFYILLINLILFGSQLLFIDEWSVLLNGSLILIVTHLLLFSCGILFYFLFGQKGDKIGLLIILLMIFVPTLLQMSETLASYQSYSLFTWFNEFNLALRSNRLFSILIRLIGFTFIFIVASIQLFRYKDIH